MKPLFITYSLLAIWPLSTSAATMTISNLDQLGSPGETLNTTSNSLPTYDGREVASVADVSTKDATFALLVDFNSPASGVSQNEILWETGAGTIGMSLAYNPQTATVSLRQVSNGGFTLLQVDQTLSAGQLAAGDLEIIWTFDTDGSPGGNPQIELYIDEVSAGTDSNASSQPDWSGGDGAEFGFGSGSVTGNGSNGSLPNTANFADGTINLTSGLRFWPDTHAVIPEPTSSLLVIFGMALSINRRKRR